MSDTQKKQLEQLTTPSGDINPKYAVNKGDILFARTGASVGKSYLYHTKDGNLYFVVYISQFSD